MDDAGHGRGDDLRCQDCRQLIIWPLIFNSESLFFVYIKINGDVKMRLRSCDESNDIFQLLFFLNNALQLPSYASQLED